MTEQPTQSEWGRVDADGTVYVKTADGERAVGQWLDSDPAAALAFYTHRYDGLAVEVDLLEQRTASGALSPEEAESTAAKLRETIAAAQAVGDLEALLTRLDGLGTLVEQRKAARRLERAAKVAEARISKTKIAEEAEELATGGDWRNGANRLRGLLTEWKVLPRLDKATDDELWHRFSTARTTYTRRRKQHFAELNEKRDSARVVKEKLADEAEALATSTDWGATARAYRDLMTSWKAAGGASKEVDDALWARFRAAQDAFFGARDKANAEIADEYAANAEVKRGLLVQAEALLPITSHKEGREAFREIAGKWDAAGKVPRSDIKDLEARFKKVEQAVRGAEDDQWSRSNPEGYARASATVTQLEASIADLETEAANAEAGGDAQQAAELREDAATKQSWLVLAEKALDEFSS